MDEVDKQKAKTIIEVLNAYLEGKQIQYRHADGRSGWLNVYDPSWNWDMFNYRVKPEYKYRPLKPDELHTLKGKWLINKFNGSVIQPTGFVDDNVVMWGALCTPQHLLEFYLFEDGLPVGIKED